LFTAFRIILVQNVMALALLENCYSLLFILISINLSLPRIY
jgi:hypothetical protein